MICPHCGSEISNEARFCTECGVPITILDRMRQDTSGRRIRGYVSGHGIDEAGCVQPQFQPILYSGDFPLGTPVSEDPRLSEGLFSRLLTAPERGGMCISPEGLRFAASRLTPIYRRVGDNLLGAGRLFHCVELFPAGIQTSDGWIPHALQMYDRGDFVTYAVISVFQRLEIRSVTYVTKLDPPLSPAQMDTIPNYLPRRYCVDRTEPVTNDAVIRKIRATFYNYYSAVTSYYDEAWARLLSERNDAFFMPASERGVNPDPYEAYEGPLFFPEAGELPAHREG